jgi:hypothetical protein
MSRPRSLLHFRESNDAANAPILHLNEEMAYEPAHPVLELHRKLRSG